jgi:hypothetical protein
LQLCLTNRVYGKIQSGTPTLVHKPKLALLIVFTLSGSLLLPGKLAAQQIVAFNTGPAALPDAPTPQISDPDDPLQSSTSAPQQTTTPMQTPAPQDETPEQRKARAAAELKAEEQQRIVGVIPNFNTVNSGKALPISSGQKFHLFFKSAVDPYPFALAAVDAGIGQAEDSNPGYNQGVKGFLRRYGANYGDNVDGNFWGNAVLPSLLHQDPRYFRLGHGTFVRRAWYSVLTTVRCRGDDGNWQVNASNLTGNLIGAAISNAYYPDGDRGLYPTLRRGLSVTYQGTIGGLLEEFYPDVADAYKRHRANKKAAAQTTP